MKKKLLFLGTLIIIAISFSSCEELLDNCETCRYNVYEDGVLNASLTYGEAEYCGADLIAKKAALDVSVGNKTTKFECD